MSAVVKEYRNLIHPGRVIRLRETVDEQGATVAVALVQLVVKEVESTKRQIYGSTAEQVVSKIEHDSSVVSVIDHILKDVSDFELERLLLSVLPRTYFEHLGAIEDMPGDNDEIHRTKSTLSALSRCFRRGFERASDGIKGKVTKNFVRIIKEEGKRNVFAYEADLFSAQDLQYLSVDDCQLVKQHLLARVESDKELNLDAFYRIIRGIGSYISESVF